MKKLARILAGAVCLAAIVLAGCENADGSCDLAWTLSWIAVAFATGMYLNRTERHEGRRQG